MEGQAQQGSSASAMAREALEKAKSETTASKLRDADKMTTGLLDDLKAALADISDLKRAQVWLETIEKLQGQNLMPRFVIGMFGDTGSGKSSLINAVLDEERVRSLGTPPRTYAILKAVYPGHSDQQLTQTDPAVLANHSKVREVIGSTIVIEEEKCEKFYTEIQAYVDSEEKRGQKATESEPTEPSMAFWPLIKVVRVFLKSEVLSTGVVLVDLPGGRDCNATRAAVAEKYVKECSRLWIVAPITRAGDDKAAKTLMGENFKQQLKYDGSYTNITFICTKADDIAIDEAAQSLGIADYIAKEQDRRNTMKSDLDAKKIGLKTLEAEKKNIQEQLHNVSKDLENWQGLHKQVSKGGMAYAPFESPRKRKRQPTPSPEENAMKKVKKELGLSDTEDESSDDSDSNAADSDDDGPAEAEPLTAETTRAKVDELKATKKTVRDEKRGISKQISPLKATIKDLNIQRSSTKTNMYRECIQGRNVYSRDAIKEDFAFGMKELDEELLAELQEDVPQVSQTEKPDYVEIGKRLPVYCISSRGYQQLRGRMKKDHRVVGFTSLEDTEIPGLRRHTLEIAASVQASHFRHHLSEICRLLGAMDLFVTGDMAAMKLSNKEKEDESQHLQKSLGKLGKSLGEHLSAFMDECHTVIKKVILKRMRKGASNASDKAHQTAQSWGLKPESGGLRFMTYRATCRRGGIFKGAGGLRDFNEDLLKPMKNDTAHGWDQAFNKRLPEKLENLGKVCVQLIDAFHEAMKDRRFIVQNKDLVQAILFKHIVAQNENLYHIAKQHQMILQNKQREANRVFYPAIQDVMLHAYELCTQQRGTGAFITMKQIMEDHVESEQHTMFKDAADKVESAVNNFLKDLKTSIHKDINGIVNAMDEDYTSLIGAVATEADNRGRKVLGPALRGLYQRLLSALTTIEEESASEIVDIEDEGEADDDSSYHESD